MLWSPAKLSFVLEKLCCTSLSAAAWHHEVYRSSGYKLHVASVHTGEDHAPEKDENRISVLGLPKGRLFYHTAWMMAFQVQK